MILIAFFCMTKIIRVGKSYLACHSYLLFRDLSHIRKLAGGISRDGETGGRGQRKDDRRGWFKEWRWGSRKR